MGLRGLSRAVRPLIGERVVVRRFATGDAGALQRYRDDPATALLQGWDVPYTVAQAEAFVAWAMLAPLGAPGAWCQLAIERRDRPGLVGDVGVRTATDPSATVELGITLTPGARGQGLATGAVDLVLAHLAHAHGVSRAVAWLHVDNQASAALFERLGFTLRATEVAADGTHEHRYERELHPG